jgi:hypothetical protein
MPNNGQHIVKMTPGDLNAMPGNGEGFLSLQVQGVSTQHRLYCLYLSNGKSRYVYCVFPDGGPYSVISKWYGTPRDMTCWTLSEMHLDLVRDIHQHVLDAAFDELAAELTY